MRLQLFAINHILRLNNKGGGAGINHTHKNQYGSHDSLVLQLYDILHSSVAIVDIHSPNLYRETSQATPNNIDPRATPSFVSLISVPLLRTTPPSLLARGGTVKGVSILQGRNRR